MEAQSSAEKLMMGSAGALTCADLIKEECDLGSNHHLSCIQPNKQTLSVCLFHCRALIQMQDIAHGEKVPQNKTKMFELLRGLKRFLAGS